MSPAKNPFRPPPGTKYSKSQVTRAGDFLRRLYFQGLLDGADGAERDLLIQRAVDSLMVLHWWRNQHARPLAAASGGLRYHVEKVTGEQPQVTQRLKRVPTMIDKLNRHDRMELARMGDIGGVRARLPGIQEVYSVVDRLTSNRWKIRGKPHDYIANPKDDGYRAYHLLVIKKGYVIEIQLRTENQDTWANQVERDGRMGAQGYKFGRGEPVVRNYYRVVAEVFASLDASLPVSLDLRDRLKRSYDEVRKLNPTPTENQRQ